MHFCHLCSRSLYTASRPLRGAWSRSCHSTPPTPWTDTGEGDISKFVRQSRSLTCERVIKTRHIVKMSSKALAVTALLCFAFGAAAAGELSRLSMNLSAYHCIDFGSTCSAPADLVDETCFLARSPEERPALRCTINPASMPLFGHRQPSEVC